MVYLLTKFGFIMLFCSFAAFFIPPEYSFLLAIISLISTCGFFIFGKKSREIAVLFVAAVLGFGISAIQVATVFYPSEALDGISASMSGTVTEVSSGSGNPVYTVKTDYVGVDGAPHNIKVLVSGWEENSVKAYDKIECEVTFKVYGETNSGFLRSRSDKTPVFAYLDSPMEITGNDRSSFGYHVHLIREKISSVIYGFFVDWHAPFFDRIILGTQGELEPDITKAFRKSGMSHILAISGMHMVIIVGLFEKLLGYKNSDGNIRKAETVLLILVTAAYMFIGGLGMSVLRSGFMLITHYLSRLFLSGSKSLDNLGIAIVAVLLVDPSASCDIGFLMSATSCFAISLFASPFKKFVLSKLHSKGKPFADFIAEAFCVSVVAFLAVLPISAAAFGEISLVSPFSNIFSAFFAQLTIIFGLLTVFFGAVPFLGFLAGGTAFLAMLSSGIMLNIAEFFANLPFSYVDAGKNWFYIWLFGSAMLILFPVVAKTSFRYIRHSLLASVFVLLAGFLLDILLFSGVSEINITAIEHGTAISCSKDGKTVLISKGLGSGDRFDLDFSGSDYDIIVSLDAESGSAEHDIVTASEPEIALLSTGENAGRHDNSMPVSAGTLLPGNGDKVEILPDSAVCIETNGVRVLYIFAECDIMDIKPEFRRPDIAVLDGVSPEDFPILRCGYLILRENGGFYSGTDEITVLKDGRITFFAHKENIRKGRFTD